MIQAFGHFCFRSGSRTVGKEGRVSARSLFRPASRREAAQECPPRQTLLALVSPLFYVRAVSRSTRSFAAFAGNGARSVPRERVVVAPPACAGVVHQHSAHFSRTQPIGGAPEGKASAAGGRPTSGGCPGLPSEPGQILNLKGLWLQFLDRAS